MAVAEPRRSGPATPVLEARALWRTYRTPAGEVHALRDVSHVFEPGRVTAVVGPSGSGKTTLLNLLAGFDRPTSGEVRLEGRSLGAMSERTASASRRHQLGFLFQSANLIEVLSAARNVAFPMALAGTPPRRRDARALALLDRFGVGHRAEGLPRTLSGGERQRVALARALANDPGVVFADEPTGNLDSVAGGAVLSALQEVAADGRTVVVVTHDPAVAGAADEIIRLRDGSITEKRDMGPWEESVDAHA